jgi:two-component system, chemotaxis family, chemotaxis protein CheY
MMVPLNIMIVDDSTIMRRNVRAVMEALGHTIVCECKSGDEALEQYEVVNPDMVTMDISMPILNGIKATKCIIKKYPDASIVMITSHGQETMVLEAIKAGAKGYLLKPVLIEKAQETILSIIQKKMAK